MSNMEAAIIAGAARALRKRAEAQRQRAKDGTVPAGEKYPNIMVRSGEAAIADGLADLFSRIADEIETPKVPFS